MKVLLIHNFYQSSSPSGEGVVFQNELKILEKNGIDVIKYTRHNDEIQKFGIYDKLGLPFKNIWSIETYREIKKLIKKEKPDIAHFHNIWYLISPSAYYACKDAGVPIVQTLHNFRIFCANGLLLRNGKVCEACLNRAPWRSVLYGCYRGSHLCSIPIAMTEWTHQIVGTWKNVVNTYIALTNFSKNKFIQAGLKQDKIYVKPNFLTNPPEPDYSNNGYAIFIGRLSKEKGIDILIEAFKRLSISLKLIIVGSGLLKNKLEKTVKLENLSNIQFVCSIKHEQCIELLKKSSFLIMPSVCYEGFPVVICESFACGKPVIASNLGAMAELVEDGKTGFLFEPGNPEDLALKIKWMMENEDVCIEMGKNARKVFEEKYTGEKNFYISLKIYQNTLREK